ncbi:MAG: heparinase II/III family protein, partial [Bacteroidota bacterium]
HKDSVLLKSVKTLINLTDKDGEFFPINDAQKGMSYFSRELKSAVGIGYHYGTQDPELLSIAKKQNQVALDDSGIAVAAAISEGKAEPFLKNTVKYSDGPNGNQGGLAILRQQNLELLFKYTAQGLSHGHYDKLSFMLYEDGEDVVQDYGMARFVNIEQKGGGNYLKENKTWAKHSIAHNTLVVNKKSHFDGTYETGSKHHSEEYFFDASNPKIHVASAKEKNAYPGMVLHRTLALISSEEFDKPFLLDVLKVTSNATSDYDFPLHFLGQVIQHNFDYKVLDRPEVLGEKNGYQHLFLEGKGTIKNPNAKFTWLRNNKFYTWTSTTNKNDEFLFTRLGANDSEFNLRRDASLLLRRKESQNTSFVSAIEAHGSYNPVTELSKNSKSSITELMVVMDTNAYTAVLIKHVGGKQSILIISNQDSTSERTHKLKIQSKEYQWKGPYHFIDFKK